MELKNKYPSCAVLGGGKLHAHTGDKGQKFKIVTMSAEKVQIRTASNVEVEDIVTLKLELNNGLYMVSIKAVGKVSDKSHDNSEFEYTIEFVSMSDGDKEEIDQIMKRSCNISD